MRHKGPNLEITCFRLSPETKRRLEEKAAKSYRPVSIQLRYIVELFLDGKLVPVDSVSQENTKAQQAIAESNVG